MANQHIMVLTPVRPDLAETVVRPKIAASTPGPKRVLYADVLRILAGVCVIIIHTSAIPMNSLRDYNSAGWWLADFLGSISRWSVPIFFMLSGAFILEYRKRYSTKQFFMKRFSKVLIPFIVWSAIYIIWQASIGLIDIRNRHVLLRHTLTGPAMYHLWFFYAILGLYLVTPILAVLVAHAGKKIIILLVVLCIVQNMLLPVIPRFLGGTNYISLPLATSYVDYFLLGWLLKEVTVSKFYQAALYLLGVVGLVVAIWGNHHLYMHAHKPDSYFEGYETVTTLLISLAVFTLIKAIPWESLLRSRGAQSVVSTLANATFGIYLIHALLLYYFITLVGQPNTSLASSLGFILGGAVILYAVSALIIIPLQRIPVLKALVP